MSGAVTDAQATNTQYQGAKRPSMQQRHTGLQGYSKRHNNNHCLSQPLHQSLPLRGVPSHGRPTAIPVPIPSSTSSHPLHTGPSLYNSTSTAVTSLFTSISPAHRPSLASSTSVAQCPSLSTRLCQNYHTCCWCRLLGCCWIGCSLHTGHELLHHGTEGLHNTPHHGRALLECVAS